MKIRLWLISHFQKWKNKKIREKKIIWKRLKRIFKMTCCLVDGSAREALRKGKTQYSWPPCTLVLLFRLVQICCFLHWKCYLPFYKSSYINKEPGKPYGRGRLSTVDLLVLTSLNQLVFIKNFFLPFHKTRFLNEEPGNTDWREDSVQLTSLSLLV